MVLTRLAYRRPAWTDLAGAVSRRALWVVPVGDGGGVARHVIDVARSGIPGHRLVVLCPGGVLATTLRELGCAVVVGDLGPGSGTLRSVQTVRGVIRALQPDIVHSHLSHADVVCAIATAGLPTRLVTTEHGIADDDMLYQSSAQRAHLMNLVHAGRLRRADAVIAVSESTAAVMARKWRAPTGTYVIPNGVDRIDTATSRAARASGVHIISLARHAPEKGLIELIDAFATLAGDDGGARLTLAGDGPLRHDLLDRVATLGLGDRVSAPGWVEPEPLLNEADVLVQLSAWENTSYSILDAVVHGLGVVATPVGGNTEILPAECLAHAHERVRIAELIAAQARDIARRPSLPDAWPTVAQMTERIADVYGALG